MRILDLVDTSPTATKHLQASGEFSVPIGIGSIPMTRALMSGMVDPGDAVMQLFTAKYPPSGGILLKMSQSTKYRNTFFNSGILYRLGLFEDGVADRTTQLNLTYTYTYTKPPISPISAGWNDVAIVLVSPLGALTHVALGSAYTLTTSRIGEAIKVEVIIDRNRKLIEMIAVNLTTGKVGRTTTPYSNYNTMSVYGIMVGTSGYSVGLNYEHYNAGSTIEALYENILLTENDRDSDPRRHGSFNLATLSDVVKADHPNATLLNKVRPVKVNQADRFIGSASVPIKSDAPAVITLRPTLMNDNELKDKGVCVALVVTADIKNVTGRYQCLGKVSGGRATPFVAPRTEPYMQVAANPGIGAQVGQIDIRHSSGIDLPAVTTGKTITIGVK